MKHLLFEIGGRPLNNDDFTVFQDEIYYAVDGQFLGLPACVVAGCDVATNGGGGYDVTAGLVYIDGAVRRFEGAAGVSLPAELFTDAFKVTELRAYQTGGSKSTMGEAVVLLRAFSATSVGERVVVQPEGVLRVAKAREGLFRSLGDWKFTSKPVASEYDTSGRGKYGTKAYGWMRAEGSGGTADARGRVPMAAGGAYSVGGKGGAASVTLDMTNLPAHTHTMDSAGSHTHTTPNKVVDGGSSVDAPTLVHGAKGSKEWPNQQIKLDNAGEHQHTIHSVGGDGNGAAVPVGILPPWLGVQVLEWVGF